ncbi:MAG: hypothetical protein CMB56_007355 [Methanobacteriota archaeon]|nr:MAG: hypothetical protein CMB56_007355 [Euryarchaeota archaeon]|tara:strand:+ start:44081 stop:45184 length:1104 start_codon:yes stop_codon:yes gene_type:complete
MATDIELIQILSAIGILLIPILVAIPIRIIWKRYVGGAYQHEEYRRLLSLVVNAGHSLSQFRDQLDEAARRRRIPKERQKLIETDFLFPLKTPHFILLPSLFFTPIVLLFATPLFLLALPLLALAEYILIRKGLLTYIILQFLHISKWQLIHIPRARHNEDELRGDIVAFSKMLMTVYLGLFAWLIVHWIFRGLDYWVIILISGTSYLILLSTLGVIKTAIDTEFVFADPAGTAIIPIERFFRELLEPLVGIGLLFLLIRDLTALFREGGDLILFSLSILIVLFSVTLVGIGVEVGHATRRKKSIHSEFSEKLIKSCKPKTYFFLREKGLIKFIEYGPTPLDINLRNNLRKEAPFTKSKIGTVDSID